MAKHEKRGITGGTAREVALVYTTPNLEVEPEILEAFLEGVTRANEREIRSSPQDFPCSLACAQVRYVDPIGCRSENGDPIDNCQKVLGITQLLQRGYGTCIDLVPAECALRRVKRRTRCRVGIDFSFDENGQRLAHKYHALLVHPNGRAEDVAEEIKQGTAKGPCSCH